MKKIFALSVAFFFAFLLPSFTAPIRSSVGAANIGSGLEAAVEPSPSDYIQNGLVALWDGEWNAGVGHHVDSTMEWVDLTGNQPPFVPINGTTPLPFGENYLIGSGNIPQNGCGALLGPTTKFTIECVFVDGGMSYEKFIFSNGIQNVFYGTVLGAATWYANHSNTPYVVYVGNGTSKQLGQTSTNEKQTFSLSLDGDSFAYKNGMLLGACVVGSRAPSGRLTLGFATNSATAGRYGYSRMYVVRIYNRALSAEEIAYNYQIDKARFGL